ncbi:MAG: 2-oxo acid dehydrogenase subunit E2, partial [Rhodoglobus sp.]|nr:2-oxo acid dehydrogenase subunit E2 [Rhodoglobus sp.]
MSSHVTGIAPEGDSSGEFGANEWLVDEMYELYQQDKNLVDKTWWPVLENYRRTDDPTPTGIIDTVPDEVANPARSDAEATPAPAADPKTAEPTAEAEEAEAVPEPVEPAAVEPEAEAPEAPEGEDKAAPAPATGTTPIARTTSVEAKPQPIPADAPASVPVPTQADADEPVVEAQNTVTVLKGATKALAANMDASLTVPTATSVRTIPAKLMIDNRIVINNHLKRARGGKVSFTHLIAWAMVQTLKEFPSQNVFYDEVDGKPSMVTPAHINLGIAIDIPKPDGTRSLVVPGVKRADTMGFGEFLTAYEDVVFRGRSNKLTAADYAGNTISLTNPGGIGTEHSVPRLMRGAGCIVGAGALEYPAEFQGASPKTLAELAIGKTVTLTSTYDHRVIQGAGSG